MIGDVKGKTAVIVDDIIDTAGTLRAMEHAAVAGTGAVARRLALPGGRGR